MNCSNNISTHSCTSPTNDTDSIAGVTVKINVPYISHSNSTPNTEFKPLTKIESKKETKPKSALFVRLEAKPGQEEVVADLLRSFLPKAQQESGSIAWHALRFGPTTFGFFDTFIDEEGRETHLSGELAKIFKEKTQNILVTSPTNENIELLAVK